MLALFPAMSTCPTSSSDLHWAACWLVCFSHPHCLPSLCTVITLACSSRAGDASIVEHFKRVARGRTRDRDDKPSLPRDHGLIYEIERSSLDGRSGEVVVTSYWSKAVGDSMRVPDSSWDDMDRVVGTCRRTKGSSSFVDTFL